MATGLVTCLTKIPTTSGLIKPVHDILKVRQPKVHHEILPKEIYNRGYITNFITIFNTK